jgi:hypothetical protein
VKAGLVLNPSDQRLEFFRFSPCSSDGLLAHAHQIFDEICVRD